MNKNITAIVLAAQDYRESDKQVTLLTSEGEIVRAVMKGVKKQGAKMKFAAQPFSFCNFDVTKNGERYTIIGANVIEELFSVTDYDIYIFGCVMLEASLKVCYYAPNKQIFILLLRLLKDLLYGENSPKVTLIAFLQGCIHRSGYAYEYPTFEGKPATVMELLTLTDKAAKNISADDRLVSLTLDKIYKRFCQIFDCELKSYLLI